MSNTLVCDSLPSGCRWFHTAVVSDGKSYLLENDNAIGCCTEPKGKIISVVLYHKPAVSVRLVSLLVKPILSMLIRRIQL